MKLACHCRSQQHGVLQLALPNSQSAFCSFLGAFYVTCRGLFDLAGVAVMEAWLMILAVPMPIYQVCLGVEVVLQITAPVCSLL
uniref:Uncharacterized protein n=1 Tax=Arundo donax TaxID=35708 RepID=A0A0A9BVB1_ARUDO